jgi:hypothetical protein
MAEWEMTGKYFKTCSCNPGCPCDFDSPPTHWQCEGILGMHVERGNFDGVSLDGVKWAVAYHWPGPLHEGNGTVKPYFDQSTSEEQLNALGQILTGQAGGGWFELVASIVSEVKEPAVVPIEIDISGRKGTVKLGNVVENRFEPIKNPLRAMRRPSSSGSPAGSSTRRTTAKQRYCARRSCARATRSASIVRARTSRSSTTRRSIVTANSEEAPGGASSY